MKIPNLAAHLVLLAEILACPLHAQVGPEPVKAGMMNTVTGFTYPEGNLVSNGSFEIGEEKWNLEGIGVGTLPDGTRPWTGRRALSVEIPGSFSGSTLSSGLVELTETPTFTYTLSFYYMASGLSGDKSVRPQLIRKFGPSAMTEFTLTGPPLSNNSSWTLYSAVFSVPVGGFAVLNLISTTGTGTPFIKLSFDDVQLVEGSINLQARTVKQVAFLDGMNRVLQTLTQDGSSDILKETRHDDMGRVSLTSLPFSHIGGHTYVPGILDDIGSGSSPLEQYYGSGILNAGGFAFNQTFYEDSPLGRVKETWGAGHLWRAASRGIRTFYGSTDKAPEDWRPGLELTIDNSHLFVEMTEGEDGEVSRIFKDRFGRIVKKEARLGAAWIPTTYTYDANNNLQTTTAPSGFGGSQVVISQNHNSLNQRLWENSTDIGMTDFMYDKMGKMRFSRSESQAFKGTFSYRKYDDLNRMIEEGEILDADLMTPENADDPHFPRRGEQNQSVRTAYFYDRLPKSSPVCAEQGLEERILIYPGAAPGSQTEYPSLEVAMQDLRQRFSSLATYSGSIHLYQIFDDPSSVISPPTDLVIEPFPLTTPGLSVGFTLNGVLQGSEENSFPFPVEWGPLKGRLVRVVTCNSELSSTPLGVKEFSKTFNYDKFGNITSIYEFNGYIDDSQNQWNLTEQTYDRQKRLNSRIFYNDVLSKSIAISFHYTYDHEGRLHEIRDQTGTVVAVHGYNSIGQLANLAVGPPGAGRVTYEYLYHLRGWPKRITARSGSIVLFDQNLKYEDAGTVYNGNISAYDYTLSAIGSPGTNLPASYSFQYDQLNRLVKAGTSLFPGGGTIWDYAYADNGSMLQRKENGKVFDYVYTVGTNRLDRIQTALSSGERNTTAPGNFQYDLTGRLNWDDSKKMDIEYDNHINRPIAFNRQEDAEPTDLNSTYMVYDEAGNRISKIEYQSGSKVSTKHYLYGGKEIRESFTLPGYSRSDIYPFDSYGRVVQSGSSSQYELYIKNHLGSTVMVHNAADNRIDYVTDFEPYGETKFQGSNLALGITPKFTGKEHDDEFNLSYFGARYYDPDIGMWISPDPAREFHSPYTYVGNNPINAFDPDGRQTIEVGGSLSGAFGMVGGQVSLALAIDLAALRRGQVLDALYVKGGGSAGIAGIVAGSGNVTATYSPDSPEVGRHEHFYREAKIGKGLVLGFREEIETKGSGKSYELSAGAGVALEVGTGIEVEDTKTFMGMLREMFGGKGNDENNRGEFDSRK